MRDMYRKNMNSVTNDSDSESDVDIASSETESEEENVKEVINQAGDEGEIVEFSTDLGAGIQRQWRGRLLQQANGKAFVIDVDQCDWQNGSKEAFIRLLEAVDECLGCSTVYLTASRQQQDLPLLMKTFMYLGFQPVAPNAMPNSVECATHVCMAVQL
jgi:hypothetical protein